MVSLFVSFSLDPMHMLFDVSLLLGLPALGWIAWTYLDWTNDLYIVTNQRVVYVEKVIGIYDSREEAPPIPVEPPEMSAILPASLPGI